MCSGWKSPGISNKTNSKNMEEVTYGNKENARGNRPYNGNQRKA